MKTRFQQMTTKGAIDGYSNFIGDDNDYKEWYGVVGQSRDSDCLERSNFETALAILGGESDDVRVERFDHWAVGWIEEVYVRPDSEAYKIAVDIEKRLQNYPVLDEEDYCQKEYEEASEVWANCYNETERVKYIRENRSQFDFNDFAELRAVIKGKYFNGYASDLLN
jgi:hypothetical protein